LPEGGLHGVFSWSKAALALEGDNLQTFLSTMDSISSAELDTTSKTPTFIGIAAIIIGVAGVVLGWLGFSKASALEAELEQLNDAAADIDPLQSQIDEAVAAANEANGKVDRINETLNKMSSAISKDMSNLKRELRSVAIQAGTAMKKLQAIEEQGLTVSRPAPQPQPAPKSVAQTAPKESGDEETADAAADEIPGGDSEIYVIQKGDMLYRIAARYNVSLTDITEANPGLDPNRLQIGQKILIPSN